MESEMRKIVLENGSEYCGTGFGDPGERVCELVFNTSMVGYQEIVSDPSYTGQAVVMTYPIIGNYGITDEDFETKTPTIGALIVREYNDNPSNFRYTKTLSELMCEYAIPGVAGVDTRKLTREIRALGSQKALITDASTPREEAVRRLTETELPRDLVRRGLQKALVLPHLKPQIQRRRRGLRHQAEHRALAERARLQRDRRALRHAGGGHRLYEAGRRVSLQRPR